MTREEIIEAAKANGWEKGFTTEPKEYWKTYDRKSRQKMRQWFSDKQFERVKDDHYGLVKDGIRVEWREGCANATITF